MWPWRLLSVFAITVAVAAIKDDDYLESDEIIEAVNAAKTTWKAGRNFHPSLKKKYIKNLLGVNDLSSKSPLQPLMKGANCTDDEFSILPKNFDAREKWNNCISLQEVRDQGACGSCWAVSTASAFTDRLCIATNGSFNGHLSAQFLMTCCAYCGSGCKGGSPGMSWMYFQDNGLVSGGDYESMEGCQPYTIPPCEHHVSGPRVDCQKVNSTTPECKTECYNKNFKCKSFEKDIHKVKVAFALTAYGDSEDRDLALKDVQYELLTTGPLTVGFYVYEDFYSYKTGVYQHTVGGKTFGHAVKLIGWGEEEGIPYWLAANSWNTDWGDKGFFKIKRGNNECGFEEQFEGGIIDV